MTIMKELKTPQPVLSNLALAYLTISTTIIIGLLGGIFNIIRTQQVQTDNIVAVHSKVIQKHDDQIVQLSVKNSIPYNPMCGN